MTLKDYLEKQISHFAKTKQGCKANDPLYDIAEGRIRAYTEVLLTCSDNILSKKILDDGFTYMTFRAEFEQGHPNWSTAEINAIVSTTCPSHPNFVKPAKCEPRTKMCEYCWERSISQPKVGDNKSVRY